MVENSNTTHTPRPKEPGKFKGRGRGSACSFSLAQQLKLWSTQTRSQYTQLSTCSVLGHVSRDSEALSEQIPARTPNRFFSRAETVSEKYLRTTPGPGWPNRLKIDISLTGFIVTGSRCPGHEHLRFCWPYSGGIFWEGSCEEQRVNILIATTTQLRRTPFLT